MKNIFLAMCLAMIVSVVAFAAAQDGTWTVQGGSQGGPTTLSLSVSGTTLSGTIDGNAISGGGVNGNTFWFNATRNRVAHTYKGTVSGNQITLKEYTTQFTTYTFVKN